MLFCDIQQVFHLITYRLATAKKRILNIVLRIHRGVAISPITGVGTLNATVNGISAQELFGWTAYANYILIHCLYLKIRCTKYISAWKLICSHKHGQYPCPSLFTKKSSILQSKDIVLYADTMWQVKVCLNFLQNLPMNFMNFN